jgi:N-carbamoyl-L-amino-acid hydrolase
MDIENTAIGVIQDLQELAIQTSDEKGAQRVAWTPVWDKAEEWFKTKMIAEGAEISVDSAHNIWAKFSGESEEAIIIGSHLDSVPNGGWLDGALGVVAGMGIGKRYGMHGVKPKKTIYIVCWADEEGARFGQSCMGSAAVSGTFTAEQAKCLKDNEGIEFQEALQPYQLKAENFSMARREFLAKPIQAYLELHIEQAPVLENAGKSVACVYGVAGCYRQYITFKGQQAHSGSPITMRQDAFLAAAEASLAFRDIGIRHQAYCTVGKVTVHPDVVTIFPGLCTISLDQRAIEGDVLEQIVIEAKQAAEQAAKDNKVTVSFETIWQTPPTIFDKSLKALCQKAVTEETGEDTTMYSGPLHDAVEISKVVPSIMMFAMSVKGLSHCMEEDTPIPVLKQAIRAFLRLTDHVLEK